jgi:NAD(P)-dependent dehydrogenase (short-subunit alcohol dehydrogenase family)
MKRLENKTAVITGGGQGIGKAIALLFAKHGARVFIADYFMDRANDAVKLIESEGGRCLCLSM